MATHFGKADAGIREPLHVAGEGCQPIEGADVIERGQIVECARTCPSFHPDVYTAQVLQARFVNDSSAALPSTCSEPMETSCILTRKIDQCPCSLC